ncbi:MAG: FtsX-like permease family protein [Pseudomonadota bacterium]
MLLKLIFRNAMRHRLRSALTVLGMAVAILSYGLLSTVIDAWYAGANAASANRLVTRNAVSLMFTLPLSYGPKIKAVPHVKRVSYANWFAGTYIDSKNFFPQFAAEPEGFLAVFPEFLLSEAQKRDFVRERNSAVAGRKLATKYGWRLGDIITLKGTIYPGQYDFVLRGIYRGARPNVDETQFIFHWNYLNERIKKTMPEMVEMADHVGWYIAEIDDPKAAARVSRTIDATFANSLAETLTETEKAFQLGFVSMTEVIVQAIRVVSFVVIGIIMIVLANTMAMSARERANEYAVLKTLGFSGGFLFAMIAGESLVLAAAGGLVGLALTFPAAAAFGSALSSFLPVFQVSPATLAAAGGAALLVGLLAALQPAWQATHLKIADALGRVG